MSPTGDPGLTRRPPAVLDHPAVQAGAWALGAALVLVVVFHFLLPRQVPYGILVLGVVTGSTYSLTAIGLILVYRANRIVNFALAEIGVLGAVLFESLIRASGWPWAAALVVGVATAGAAGLVLELGLARRFFTSSRLVLSVATIGMAQLVAFGEYAVTRAFSGQPASAGLHTPLSDFHFQVTGVVFNGNSLLLLAALPLVALALGAFLRRTDLGIATRASAENTERASLLGIPVRRLSTLAWVVASLLAGLATVLRSPVVGVVSGSTLQGPTLLLGALTVAVLARFEDIRIAVVAGLAVGAIDQGLYYADRGSTVSDIVFVGLIIVTLLLQRRRDRSDDTDATSWEAIDVVRPLAAWQRRLPSVRWGRLAIWAAVLVLVVVVPALLTPSRVFLATDVLVYAMVAVSLVVVTGWSGQISLGQFGIVAIGAAVAARLSADVGWDFLLALIFGGAAGAVVSMALGAAAFRIKGFLFAVTSLGFAVAVASFFLNARFFPYLLPTHRPERPVLFGQLDLNGELGYFYFSLVVLGLLLLAVAALRRTRTGRVLIAMRDNDRAARSFGIGRITSQLMAFALSGFVAGVAGGVLAAHDHAVSASAFAPAASIAVFSMAVIGGIGSLLGAVLGVVLVRGVTLSLTAQWAQLTTGLGLLLVLLVFPGGLGRAVVAARDAVVRRLTRDTAPPPPAPAGVVEPPEAPVRVPAPMPSASGARTPLLTCRGVDASFGPVQILFGVDLDVAEGEMLAILGTNGAGKSTLLRTVAGTVPATGGAIRFAGADVTSTPPERTSSMGIVTVPGGRGTFPGLNVAENLRVAGWLHRRDPDHLARSLAHALELFPVLADRLSQTAGTLSGGEQQMLTLAQALMARPTLLMIDELSLGLAPAVVEQLVQTLRLINARGTTVVVVEQSVNVALTVCNRAVFLERGRIRFDGPTTQLLERPDLLRAVFLDVPAATRDAARPASPAGAPVLPGVAVAPDGRAGGAALEGRHLSRSYGGIRAVDDMSLTVDRAEILGLIGPNGAGKTTVFDLLSGFSTPDGGRVLMGGVDITTWSPERRARHGMGRSFQSARLFPALTVRETVAVASDRHLDVRDPLSSVFALPVARDAEAAMWSRVDELLELTGLRAFADALVSELSTGTRRVLDIACGLAQAPQVLLLDEPATGISLQEIEQLGPLLRWLRDTTGTALLVIEHELGLVSAVADRLVAMEAGSVIAVGPPPDVVADPRVVASYLGTERRVDGLPGSAPRALLGGEE